MTCPDPLRSGWASPSRTPEALRAAVVLNYKGYPTGQFKSASDFVAGASDELWAAWKQRIPTSADIRRIRCRGILARHLLRLVAPPRPARGTTRHRHAAGFDEPAWVSDVTAWEEGRFVEATRLKTSPACLLTELASTPCFPDPHTDAAPGFEACLRLLEEMLEACPARPRGRSSVGLHLRAPTAGPGTGFGFDRQQYRLALQRGKTFQLLLPSSISAPGTERLMIVDAAATSENEPTAVLKTMLRTDREIALDGPGVRCVGALPAD